MVSGVIMEVKSYRLLLFAAKRFPSVMDRQPASFLPKRTTRSIVGSVDTVVGLCPSFINIYGGEAEWNQTAVKAISSTALLLPQHYVSGFTRTHKHTRRRALTHTPMFRHLEGRGRMEAHLSDKRVKLLLLLYHPN